MWWLLAIPAGLFLCYFIMTHPEDEGKMTEEELAEEDFRKEEAMYNRLSIEGREIPNGTVLTKEDQEAINKALRR